eukprot:gnl/Dysnectes_brevis/379_a421_4214.p1 GENE.gnl/Dysnectes_brevis/379_a421_4214~~gnl/Dysnectes_brevis/379_a421_4214.p1  ORF type:complete len:858 (-),score=387.92 gnl/Dysnectes_brevis/379_a421_4214:68-2641(-)
MLSVSSVKTGITKIAPIVTSVTMPKVSISSLSTSAMFSHAPSLEPVEDIYEFPKHLSFIPTAEAGKYSPTSPLTPAQEAVLAKACHTESGILLEHEAYEIMEAVGLHAPPHHFHSIHDDDSKLACTLKPNTKYVLKAIIRDCLHKTDIGAITFSKTTETAADAVAKFRDMFSKDWPLEGFLFVEQLAFSKDGLAGGEYILSSYEDTDFGPMLCFGIGGTGVEYSKTVMKPGSSHLFVPAKADLDQGTMMGDALGELPAAQIIAGKVRGIDAASDLETVRSTLQGLQKLVTWYSVDNPIAPYAIEEIEVNPMVAGSGRLLMLDAVLKAGPNPSFGKPAHQCMRYNTQRSGKPVHKLQGLVRPQSAAVIGASSRKLSSPGSIILQKLQATCPNVYAVHPRNENVLGSPAFPSVDALVEAKGPVDLLVVGIPAAAAGSIVSDVIRKNVAKTILTIAGGFSETKEGAVLEKDIRDAIKDADFDLVDRPVVNGPNTVGSFATDGSNTIFTPGEKSSRTGRGASEAAIIAQSGAFLITRLSDLADKVAPKLAFSVGNQMDISGTDCLEYILSSPDDKDVTVIGMYMEGLQEGEGLRLLSLVSQARQEGRQVVVYKSARSKAGKDAAQGHTAAMAGDYDLFAGLLSQSGAIVCQTAKDFEDVMTIASIWGKQRLGHLDSLVKRGQHVVVRGASDAGYECGAISDHLFTNHLGTGVTDQTPLALPEWPAGDAERLGNLWKQYKLEGIVDMGKVLDTTPMLTAMGWRELMEAYATSPTIDVGLISIVPEVANIKTSVDSDEIDTVLNAAKYITETYPEFPMVFCIESGWKYDELASKLMLEAGVPCFRHADDASRAIARILHTMRK